MAITDFTARLPNLIPGTNRRPGQDRKTNRDEIMAAHRRTDLEVNLAQPSSARRLRPAEEEWGYSRQGSRTKWCLRDQKNHTTINLHEEQGVDECWGTYAVFDPLSMARVQIHTNKN